MTENSPKGEHFHIAKSWHGCEAWWEGVGLWTALWDRFLPERLESVQRGLTVVLYQKSSFQKYGCQFWPECLDILLLSGSLEGR